MLQKTLSILKPDAVKNKLVGSIINYIYKADLNIIAMQTMRLTKAQAEAFYAVHKDRPFFGSLVDFMISGTIIVQVLSGSDAVKVYREIMGDTDPKKAKKGTIRADFAESIEANCVHGSDSDKNAEEEIKFFFSGCSILPE